MASSIETNCDSVASSAPKPSPRTVIQMVRISSPPDRHTPSTRSSSITRKERIRIAALLVFLLLLLFGPFVTIIVIGSLYLEDCPSLPYHPRLLMGAGVVGIIVYVIGIVGLFCTDNGSTANKVVRGIVGIFTLFMILGWPCIGLETTGTSTTNVTYTNGTRYVINAGSADYCNPVVKYTVLSITIYPWALFVLLLIGSCFFACSMA